MPVYRLLRQEKGGGMLNRFISCLFLLWLAITMPFFFAAALVIRVVTGPFDPRLQCLHLFTCFWSTFYCWTMPAWNFIVSGREKIDPDATYVVISNHQSQLDIPAVFHLFFHFKWVSKTEIFKIPFMGWNMRLNGYIPLRRGDRESILEMLDLCRKSLRKQSSVFIFPEGTRSVTGILRPFKPGAFQLAHELGLPILPIAIDGTRKALPKYSLNFHGRHPMKVQVLDPVPYEAFRNMGVEETAEMFRDRIGAFVSDHVKETTPLAKSA